MRQLYQQPEPPRKSFMEQYGWQLIIVLATVLATLIAAIILGTAHVIGFNLVVFILVGIMFAIMLFCIWYTFRTRQRLQEQYQEDLATLKREYRDAQNNFRDMTTQEFNRLNEGFINYSQENAKQQNERSEELKRQCMEAIADARRDLDGSIKNAQSIFSGAVDSNNRAVTLYGEQLIHSQRQMLSLEERLRQELKP